MNFCPHKLDIKYRLKSWTIFTNQWRWIKQAAV